METQLENRCAAFSSRTRSNSLSPRDTQIIADPAYFEWDDVRQYDYIIQRGIELKVLHAEAGAKAN